MALIWPTEGLAINRSMQISDRQKKIAYSFYLIAAAALFLFWLFPEDSVRNLVKRNAECINPDISIGIDKASLSFPLGVKFKDVSVFYKSRPVADLDYMRVRVGLLSIFGKSRIFFFKSGVSDGIISGKCRFVEERGFKADVQMSGLQLENILCGISQHRITGLMKGDLKIESDGSAVNADSQIDFANMTIAFATPVLGMETIQFDTVKADLSIAPRRIEIKSCSLEGQEMDGKFTGGILFRQPYKNSILNFSGFLKPQASFIKKMGKELPVDILMKKEPGADGFPVKLIGTISDPKIRLR